MHLAVSELFGPTIQGEGPLVGHSATFLRLMGCNLACRWCDTPYTWDGARFDLKAQTRRMLVEDLAADIEARGDHLLVVSGGEPMLQQERLWQLLDLLPGRRVQIETAGTVAPRGDADRPGLGYVVSPKLHHSGNNGSRYVPDAINALRDSGRVMAWKFVLASEGDYEEVDWLVQHHQLAPVYVMAEGIESWRLAQRLAKLAPGAIQRGYRLTPRMHIDLFGNRRGV